MNGHQLVESMPARALAVMKAKGGDAEDIVISNEKKKKDYSSVFIHLGFILNANSYNDETLIFSEEAIVSEIVIPLQHYYLSTQTFDQSQSVSSALTFGK